MTRRIFSLGLFLIAVLIAGQTHAQQYAFRVSFSDKAGSPPLSNPQVFLSQRALDRRAAQGIALDATDQPVSPVYVDSVLTITNGVFHLNSKWLNYTVVLLNDSAKIQLLQGKPWITDIKFVAYYAGSLHLRAAEPTGNAVFPQQKTTNNAAYYGAAWTQTSLIKGECLHNNGFRGAGKLIAVLDDGFSFVNTNRGFDSINATGRILDIRNFVRANDQVYTGGTHGMQALSTMAGNIPDTFVGAAPDAQYALYVSEDQNSEQPIEMDNLVAALERADSIGADLVSASIGYNTFYGPLAGSSLTLADIDGKTTVAAKAVNAASTKGMICVMSAGNEGGNSWNKVLTPGDADSAITVGSVNGAGVPAGNSGYGPNAANVTKPDVVALGNAAIVLSSAGGPVGIPGTSFAVPQIAGFAACLWQGRPTVSAAKIRDAIRKSANQYNNPGPQTGYGIPDFCSALATLNTDNLVNSPKHVVQLFPNPVSESLTMLQSSVQARGDRYFIADMLGRVWMSGVVHGVQQAIPVASLPVGVYVFKQCAAGACQQVVFVKQ